MPQCQRQCFSKPVRTHLETKFGDILYSFIMTNAANVMYSETALAAFSSLKEQLCAGKDITEHAHGCADCLCC